MSIFYFVVGPHPHDLPRLALLGALVTYIRVEFDDPGAHPHDLPRLALFGALVTHIQVRFDDPPPASYCTSAAA
jgi:hypothetical protein